MKKLVSILLIIALLGSFYPMAVLAEEDGEDEEEEEEEEPEDGWADSDGDGIPDQFDPFPDDPDNNGMPEDVVEQFIEAANNIKELEELIGDDDEEDDEGEDDEDEEGEDGEDDEDEEDDEGIEDEDGEDGEDDEGEEEEEGEVSNAVQVLYRVAKKLLEKAMERAAEGKNAKGLSNAALRTSGNALKKYAKDNGIEDEEDEEDEEGEEGEDDDEEDEESIESSSKNKGKGKEKNKDKGKGKEKNKDKGKGKGKGK